MEETGDLCEVRGEKTFEWKIKDFLLLSDKTNTGFESPEFYFFDTFWNIWIYPNGQTKNKSEGWINLYIVRTSAGIPVTVNYSFSLKIDNGKSDLDKRGTKVFEEKGSGLGFPRFMRRSALIERQSELIPSDVLTVICTLRNRGKTDVGGNEDSKNVHKNACVDAFAQTDEETRIGKLKEDFKDILLNGNVSDVVLKVEGQEFKCHRSILAARSPVFLAMMMHDTKEKATGVVDIQDVDPNTFPDFLNYLYTGSVESVTSENAHKLYVTSDMYQVNDLKKFCLDYMLKNISVDNFCDVITVSLRHNEKDLKEASIQFFAKMSLCIVKTSKWQTFLCENPIIGNELFIKRLELNK